MATVNPKVAVCVAFVTAEVVTIMDSTIVNVALPAVARDYDVAPGQVGAAVVSYLVSLAMAIPAAAWIGDRWGMRRVFMVALAAFSGASVLCGLAPNLTALVLFRVLQGVAAGILLPAGWAMLFRTFPVQERMRVARILALPTALAPALGPAVGGVLVDLVSWHWVFYVNVPIGVGVVTFVALFLPVQPEHPVGRFDLTGFLLAATGFGLVMYALSQVSYRGWSSQVVVVTGLVGLALIVMLAVVELRVSAPILDLRLLTDREFSTATAVSLFAFAAFTGMLYVFPLLYQDGANQSALATGLISAPQALGIMVGPQLAGYLYPRIGPRAHIVSAMLGMTVCIGLLSQVGPDTDPWLIRLVMFGVGVVMANTFIPTEMVGFGKLSAERMGSASSLFNAQRQLGSALGVAVLGGFLALLTGGALADGGQVELSSYQTTFLVCAGIAALGAVVGLALPGKDASAGRPVEAPAEADGVPDTDTAGISTRS